MEYWTLGNIEAELSLVAEIADRVAVSIRYLRLAQQHFSKGAEIAKRAGDSKEATECASWSKWAARKIEKVLASRRST